MKTLAKTLISSLTPALLLGLSGCSIHVHGKTEAHTGAGSKTAGGEQARPKPVARPTPDVVQATPKPVPDVRETPKPAPAPNPAGNVDASAGLGGGKLPTGTGSKPPVDAGGVSGGVKPTAPIDTSGVSGGVKPTAPIDTSGVSGGVKPTAPIDTSGVSGGVKPPKPVDTGVATGGVKPGLDASGIVGGGAVKPPKKPEVPVDNTPTPGGGSVKPAKPIDVSGSLGAGIKLPTRSPESIAAEKVAAEGKNERGDRELPSGSVPDGEKKSPASVPATKDKGSNVKPALKLPRPATIKAGDASAVAMVPANGEGKGQLRTPVLVKDVSCNLSVNELNQGAKLRVSGQGFVRGVKVTVGGISVPVAAATATRIDAKLPAELANGGDVAISQGNVVANCGKLTIIAADTSGSK